MNTPNEETAAIINRIRRKIDIMRMDQKSSNSIRYHDSGEILTLIDMLERNLGMERGK
jgi:hypothetical protein